jgi:cytochrome c556
MIRTLLGSLVIIAGVTAALAQSDPIAARRNIMKENGAATRMGTQMVKGEIPFDLAKAQNVLQTYAKSAKNFHEFFPENAKTGGETTASPKIWEDQADFRARFDQWGKDIAQAAEQTKDLESFKASFATVTKACGSCHQTYRIRRS